MTSTHTHKWIERPCDLTGTYHYTCKCGAERSVEVDQDQNSTITVVEPDGEENVSHYIR